VSIAFVHLSDIHFGQEKGGQLIVNNDAKTQLLADLPTVVSKLPSGRAAGLIVTGDIAYAGKAVEYRDAADWLDDVSRAAGCEITDVQLVPGNHDIDHAEITTVTEFMLGEIKTKGQEALDRFLADDDERAILYRRFRHFMPFADGYRCPLNLQGGYAEERIVNLAPGRSIRFVRLNSALICGKKDVEGSLLLGARQRIINARKGEELVVLSHHPLNWFQDGVDAGKFIRSRARVLITGHEHNPSVRPENVEPGCDILVLAAGATVPPHADEVYTYNYNVIELGWDEANDGLWVRIHPRTWNDDRKRFEADTPRMGEPELYFSLACPHFRAAQRPGASELSTPEATPTTDQAASVIILPLAEAAPEMDERMEPPDYSLLVLRFFRDITPQERITLLVEYQALPDGWTEVLSNAHERIALDAVVRNGRGNDLAARIDALLADRKKGEG